MMNHLNLSRKLDSAHTGGWLSARLDGQSPAAGLNASGRRLLKRALFIGLSAISLLSVTGLAAAKITTLLASLSGHAYLDSNGNGWRDPGENHGIANVPVSVSDASGSWVVITSTGNDGLYVVTGLPAGTYTVTALLEPAMGLIPTSPTSHHAFLSESGNLSGLDFGFLMTNAVYFAESCASRRSDGIHVDWSTKLEIGNAGFVLYRAASPAGAFERLNEELIPAAAISGGGADYYYQDQTAPPGVSYYYVIEAEPGLQNIGPFPTISFRHFPLIQH